jgi:6-phosphofructokinase 2
VTELDSIPEKKMTQIVTLTVNPALDKSTEVENVVAERKLRCDPPQWQPGGGGINVARVVQRLGGTPLAVYPAGGPQGEMFRRLLDDEDLAQQAVPIDRLTRESFAVREKATNQQYRFSVPGPTLSETEWRNCLAALQELDPVPDYVVLSGGLAPGVPDDFYGRVASWAMGNGARVILDTHDEPLRQGVEAGVFLLKPNLRELRQLMGQALEGEEEQERALQRIVEDGGARYVVLSLGAAGAIFAAEAGTKRLRAPTVTIRSKVGAGDSMVGGIVWALAAGFGPLEAARFGVAAGAAAVKTPGSDLCHRDDAMELYEQIRQEVNGTAAQGD